MTPPLHAPSPAASATAWRRRALLVPLLAAASAGLLAARLAWDSDTFQDCHYLGPSTRMYVTSWAGLACALGSLLVFAALRRATHGRGVPTGATWRQGLATAAAAAGLLLALALLATVYWLYSADPAGGNDCSGLVRLVVP